MNAQKCCPNALKGVQFLVCCRCQGKYHYSCVNFSKEDFLGFTKDFKDKWVCPSCRCKEPRKGDNSNTPLRASAPVISVNSYVTDNVTLRNKPLTSANCGCLSADTIREIIREELDRKLDIKITDFESKLEKFEQCLAISNSEYDRINTESESQKVSLTELRSENEELRNSARDLSRRLLQAEQLSRAANIEIQCVPENSKENLYRTVQQLGNIIKCPVADSDLEYCSRIAKLNTASLRPRSILVKFSGRRLRDTFLAGVIKYNRNNPSEKINTSHLGIGSSKKSPVFVTEHLTPETKALHAAARQKAKELNYRFVWVRDGKVFLRKSENSHYILVKEVDNLNKLG